MTEETPRYLVDPPGNGITLTVRLAADQYARLTSVRYDLHQHI